MVNQLCSKSKAFVLSMVFKQMTATVIFFFFRVCCLCMGLVWARNGKSQRQSLLTPSASSGSSLQEPGPSSGEFKEHLFLNWSLIIFTLKLAISRMARFVFLVTVLTLILLSLILVSLTLLGFFGSRATCCPWQVWRWKRRKGKFVPIRQRQFLSSGNLARHLQLQAMRPTTIARLALEHTVREFVDA